MRMIYCTIIGLTLLFIIIPVLSFSPCDNQVQLRQDQSEESAHTTVNITLTDTTTTYKRITDFPNPEEEPGIRRYFAIAKLTTHSDIFLRFNVEFSTTDWNGNFDLFKNSSLVDDFKNYQALKQLIPFNISTLDIEVSSLELHHENFSETEEFFVIEQMMVLRQTTTFLIALPEPFMFDLNRLELGQLSDFHYESEYVNDEESSDRHVHEEVRIKAPGTALDYIPSTQGYSGFVYLTPSQFDTPEPVPRYQRYFTDSSQDITLSIKLPVRQTISFDFDSVYKTKVSDGERDNSKEGNIATFMFASDSYLPHYIKLSSYTEFLAQFSLSDYFSIGLSGLIGLITVVKGIPYFFRRRSFNNFKKSLHGAVEEKDTTKFESLQEKALNDFMRGKLSASQVEEVRSVVQLLKRYMDTTPTPKKQETPSLEQLLGE